MQCLHRVEGHGFAGHSVRKQFNITSSETDPTIISRRANQNDEYTIKTCSRDTTTGLPKRETARLKN